MKELVVVAQNDRFCQRFREEPAETLARTYDRTVAHNVHTVNEERMDILSASSQRTLCLRDS